MNKLCYLSFLLTFLPLLSKTVIRTAAETNFSETTAFEEVTSESQPQSQNEFSSGISSSLKLEETVEEKTQIFENEFQMLLSELLNSDESEKTNFIKFAEELISDYKTKIVSDSDQSGRSFISFSINFSNNKVPGGSLCDSFAFSLEKTYDAENTNFRKGIFEAFLINDSFDKSELSAPQEYENLTLDQKLQLRKNQCIRKGSQLQENGNNFNAFIPATIRKDEILSYDQIKNAKYVKNIDNIVCSDIPIPVCTRRETNGNGNDTFVPTINMEGNRDDSNTMLQHEEETEVVNGIEQQSQLQSQQQAHVEERGNTGVTGLQQSVSNENAQQNNIQTRTFVSSSNYKGDGNVRQPNTEASYFEGDIVARTKSILGSFYAECSKPSITKYNEKEIKELIEKAGTRRRRELISPKLSKARPAPTLSKPTFDVIDAIIHITMKIENSIINNNIEECKLNKYALKELIKMSGSFLFALSLSIVFVIFVMLIQ